MNISVKWVTEDVQADSSLLYLITYENMNNLFKLPREEFLLKFYNPLQLNRKKVLDKELSDLDWEIHQHSLLSYATQLYFVAKDPMKDQRTFTQLMLEYHMPTELIDYPPNKKRVAYKMTCVKCGKKEEFDQYRVNMIYQSKKSLPRTCLKCKGRDINSQ